MLAKTRLTFATASTPPSARPAAHTEKESAPLHPRELDVVIETPRGSAVKRTDDGRVDFISPLPCPFNYGSVPDTRSDDGDRLDAVVLGPTGRNFGAIDPTVLVVTIDDGPDLRDVIGDRSTTGTHDTCPGIESELVLARGDERRREIAVRASLGAGRSRIIRQLLLESGLLAFAGGVLGLLLAFFGVRALIALRPAAIPRIDSVSLDATALVFAGGVALLTVLLFGVVPALQLSRTQLSRELREGGRSATGGKSRQRFRQGLVVAELALSVILVIGAGLMLRTLDALQRVDLGFDEASVLTAQLSLPEMGYEEPEDVERFISSVIRDVRALPGVRDAGAGRLLPLTGEIGDWSVTVEGLPPRDDVERNGDWQIVTDGYFEAMGMRLVEGRWFTANDNRSTAPVAVVNQTMADAYWPGGRAIGSRYRLGFNPDRPWITIVGVVEDVRHNSVLEEPRREMYVPHAQWNATTNSSARRTMALVVRTAGDPLALVPGLRSVVRSHDPGVPLAEIRTLENIVGDALSGSRFAAVLLAVFAAIALALATVGTYGVIAYGVAQRKHEMGIRMALGASQADVIRLVLAGGGTVALIGIAAGMLGALGLSRVMSGLVYGVATLDPLTFLAVPVLLAATALAACWLPARRAAATHPATALRSE